MQNKKYSVDAVTRLSVFLWNVIFSCFSSFFSLLLSLKIYKCALRIVQSVVTKEKWCWQENKKPMNHSVSRVFTRMPFLTVWSHSEYHQKCQRTTSTLIWQENNAYSCTRSESHSFNFFTSSIFWGFCFVSYFINRTLWNRVTMAYAHMV